MSRSVHCSRASTRLGPVPHQSSEPSESFAWSEPCEPPPMWCERPQSRNSQPGPRRREHLAGRAAAQRATRRDRAHPGSAPSVTRPSRTSSASTSRSPSTLQLSPRRSVRSPRGAKRSSPRVGAHRRLAVRVVGEVHDQVDALEREQRPNDARDQRGRARRDPARTPARRASSGTAAISARAGLRLAHAARRQHAEAVERAEQVDLVLDLRLRVVRADDHRVVLEERVRAAGGVHQPLDLLVGGGERRHLGVRAVLVRVRVVVGQRQQQEVEQVVLDQVLADAAGVLVAHARAGPSCERQPVLRDAKMSA